MSSIPFVAEDPAFALYSDRAAYAAMSDQDRRNYDASVKAYRDYRNTIDYAKEEAREQGLAEGRAEGLAEGRAEGMSDVVRELFKNGLPIESIAKYTSIAVETVKKMLDR